MDAYAAASWTPTPPPEGVIPGDADRGLAFDKADAPAGPDQGHGSCRHRGGPQAIAWTPPTRPAGHSTGCSANRRPRKYSYQRLPIGPHQSALLRLRNHCACFVACGIELIEQLFSPGDRAAEAPVPGIRADLPAQGVCWRWRSSASKGLARMDAHAAPRRAGCAALPQLTGRAGVLGEVHGLAGSKAMVTPAGQVSCLVAKSRAKLVLP